MHRKSAMIRFFLLRNTVNIHLQIVFKANFEGFPPSFPQPVENRVGNFECLIFFLSARNFRKYDEFKKNDLRGFHRKRSEARLLDRLIVPKFEAFFLTSFRRRNKSISRKNRLPKH